MDEVKRNEYWKLIDDFYEKAPDSEQLFCGHEEWGIEFMSALENFEKGMAVSEIRKILDDVFIDMVDGCVVLGSITMTILPILIHDWLNEVENPTRVGDFF
jgi:hypothetical protein